MDKLTPVKRTPKLSFDQYSAACRWAQKVYEKKAPRSEALNELESSSGINRNSAAVLLNNYRCMVEGQTFKAPMSVDALQHFVDAIVGRYGAPVGDKVIASVEGYLQYALATWGGSGDGMSAVVSRLREDLLDGKRLLQLAFSAGQSTQTGAETVTSGAASEILREIWARGPQHAAFRRALRQRWDNRCAVHGVECNGQLRASHIVPWSVDESLRGDVDNGLLLSVPLDCLFDQGLITFDDDGGLLVANELGPETARHFGLQVSARLRWDGLSEGTRDAIRHNLERHRALFSGKAPFERLCG